MEYIERIVEDAIIKSISEDEKKAIIKKHIEKQLIFDDISKVINEAITARVKSEVVTYISENPNVFNGIPGMIDCAFKDEISNASWIKKIIKKFVYNATIRYYLDRQIDRYI